MVNLDFNFSKGFLKVSSRVLSTVAFGQSDVGKKRARNEDHYCILEKERLFVVADGMGGHAGGETASRIAVSTIAAVIRSNSQVLSDTNKYSGDLENSPVAKLLSDALRSACQEIFREGSKNISLQGMGTTATGLLLHNNEAFIGHVGDSRAYLMRAGRLLQLSEDHSLVNEQLKAGLITSEQAQQSRFRNIITRSIGFEDDVDVDMIALKVLPEDTFLLCTDGLTTLVTDPEISDILANNYLYDVPQLLINLANSRGGDDNITIVIVHADQEQK